MRLSALAFAALVLFASFADADPGVSSKEILIGSCAVLSGASQYLGSEELAGANAYLDYINSEQGGVHGRKVRLVSYDDEFNPEKAIACFKKLTDEDEIFAGAFFTGSPSAVKISQMAEDRKVPTVGFISGASFLYQPLKRYVFNARTSYHVEADNLIQALWNQAGSRRIAILYQNDALGAAILEGTRAALDKLGAKPVEVASFNYDGQHWDPKVIDEPYARVKAAKPDTLVVGAVGAPLSVIYPKTRADHWDVLVAASLRDPALFKAGKAIDGLLLTQVVPPPTETRLRTVALYNRLLKKYQPFHHPEYMSLEGFIHAMLLVDGLKRAGNPPTRDGLVAGLESIHDVDIGLGSDFNVRFGADNHQAFEKDIITIVRDGKAVPIKDLSSLKRSNLHH